MTKPSNSQSLKRSQESIGSLFSTKSGEKGCLILKSSSDIGVIRNGGRNGARFAPQSFLSTFRKLSQNPNLKDYTFQEVEVANSIEEQEHFQKAQLQQAQRILENLKDIKSTKLLHLGGGHDHVFPLLLALSEKYEKVIVINIDAHADTRNDSEPHSGTPFRQFAQSFNGQFHLFQIGLHPYANSFSTLSPLEKGEHHILWKNQLSLSEIKKVFVQICEMINEKTLVLFSLDADALSGAFVPGVSAVNPEGLSLEELSVIWNEYQNLPLRHETLLGIYELNPLYDTLACISMRALAGFVFQGLNRR